MKQRQPKSTHLRKRCDWREYVHPVDLDQFKLVAVATDNHSRCTGRGSQVLHCDCLGASDARTIDEAPGRGGRPAMVSKGKT